MIYDHICHDVDVSAERPYIIPRPKPSIDFGVINRIKASISTVNRIKKRQQMHRAKHLSERPGKQSLQRFQIATGKPVSVGNELNLVFHFFEVMQVGMWSLFFIKPGMLHGQTCLRVHSMPALSAPEGARSGYAKLNASAGKTDALERVFQSDFH